MATTEDVQELRNQNAQLLAAVQQLQAQAQQQAALNSALQGLPQAIGVAVAAAGQRPPERRTLVDQKGLGKPQAFSGKEVDFYVWARKLETYVASVYPDVRFSLAWVIEQEVKPTMQDLALADPILDEAQVGEINEGLYVVLSSLTDAESFDIVVGSGAGEGYEAWRRLHRRWDPYTAGRARSLLKDILNPGRSSLKDLNAAIERLEDMMRRYQSRRDAAGQQHQLSEDIKMASLEALLPQDLEKHCQMNASRLASYATLREEIVRYCETRGAVHERPGGNRRKDGDDPMDVGAFGKGKDGSGKGKGDKGKKGKDGKGKEVKTDAERAAKCHICGKTGHYARNCWWKDTAENKSGKDKGGKGKKGKDKDKKKGSPKGANAMDKGEPETEQGVFELAAAWPATDETTNAEWVKIAVDTGAGATAWPEHATYGTKLKTSRGMQFRTATGEIVDAGMDYHVAGWDAWGQKLGMKGVLAPVCKPLLSVGEVTTKGGAAIMLDEVGYLLTPQSRVLKQLRGWLEKEVAKAKPGDVVELHKERNVYNLYVQAAAQDMCPAAVVGGASSSSSGGWRQGHHP